MANLDLTEGLCGWNSNEKENDDDSSTLSKEMELRNMFNKLRIINQAKIPNNRTQRPKSSSSITNTRRRLHEQNMPKTARTLPKQNGNRTNISPASITSKTSKKALIKAYLPQSYNRKKLQRSHSNLYIRDTNKRKTNNNISNSILNKKQKTINLDLDLNLALITDITEPVPFSEALFRSNSPETSRIAQSNRKHRQESSKDELSLNPNESYKQQLKNKPFLTPSASMLSLHEKSHKKFTTKSRRNQTMSNRAKTTRKSRRFGKKTSAIPIKCFNSNVLTTHQPKINTHRHSQIAIGGNINYRLSAGQREKRQSDIPSQSIDLSDNKENEMFIVSDIERYHRKILRTKENINIVRDSKCSTKGTIANMSLEQNLKHVIARWESHEKMKTRKSCRSRRIPLFK